MNKHLTSPSFPNGLGGLKTEAEARGNVTTLDVIKRCAALTHPATLGCPFCGTDAPLAAKVCGRYVIACENDDCHADVQVAGATNEEAWARWNTRA